MIFARHWKHNFAVFFQDAYPPAALHPPSLTAYFPAAVLVANFLSNA